MKIQYLGDSKDSFTWDYLDFLTRGLKYAELGIVWMMTPGDGGKQGSTAPERFPARPEILALCHRLRAKRDPAMIHSLPKVTGANYTVTCSDHEPAFDSSRRHAYFKINHDAERLVMFVDPDNGFEPAGSCSDKHIRYTETSTLLQRLPAGSVLTVLQHFRRIRFDKDFSAICERLDALDAGIYASALYWHSIMMVSLTLSASTSAQVEVVNDEYCLLTRSQCGKDVVTRLSSRRTGRVPR